MESIPFWAQGPDKPHQAARLEPLWTPGLPFVLPCITEEMGCVNYDISNKKFSGMKEFIEG
jgi:hypothetical protein